MRRLLHLVVLGSIVLSLLLLPPVAAAASDQQYYYGFINVGLAVQKNGDMNVTEAIQYVFTSGSFHHAYRTIDMSKVESIDNISVSEGGQAYRPVNSETQGGYTVSRSGNNLQIDWWFPYTSNASRTFTLSYTVHGGIRIYDAGDQVYWNSIWPDRGQEVAKTSTTVQLPDGAQADKIASYGASAKTSQPDASTVVFDTGSIPDGSQLTVRVQFPHGIVPATVPSWQQADDARIARDQQLAPIKALFSLISIVLGLVIPVIGGILLYSHWYNKGRDKPVGLIAEYIPDPPSDLPAGVVGTLIDEEADLRDIVATIVDLGRRGVLSMAEKETSGFFGTTKRDFIYTLIKPNADLRPYEHRLIQSLFGSQKEVALSDLRDKFYTAIPELKKLMYQETVKEGFFPESPNATRTRWAAYGSGLLVLAVVAFIVLIATLGNFSGAAVCPAIALGIVGVMVAVAGRYMPRRTDKGAEATAKWKAFSRYLEHIEKYTDIKQAKDIFDKYLPYTISFGLERSWVQKFSQVDTPAPAWWGPYLWGPAYTGPATSSGGGGAASIPSLQGTSDSMMGGLQGMSDGLMSMINSAGSVLTSVPSSSGSGGGWSGGGFGGGGGGGGGGGSGAN